MRAMRAPARSMWNGGAAKHAAAAGLLAFAAAGLGASMFAPRVPADTPAAWTGAAVRIDLNKASAAELELLPRIGPALAKRIVEDRLLRGEFRSLDDLDRVRGIGARTIDGLRPFARVETGPE